MGVPCIELFVDTDESFDGYISDYIRMYLEDILYPPGSKSGIDYTLCWSFDGESGSIYKCKDYTQLENYLRACLEDSIDDLESEELLTITIW